jgi:hypothetical protein
MSHWDVLHFVLLFENSRYLIDLKLMFLFHQLMLMLMLMPMLMPMLMLMLMPMLMPILMLLYRPQ